MTPSGSICRQSSRRDRRAAVDDDGPAGDESAGARRRRCPRARRGGAAVSPPLAGGAALRVLVEHVGEFGFDETRGDAVNPHIARPPFDREVAAEGIVGGLRHAVHSEHRRRARRRDPK